MPSEKKLVCDRLSYGHKPSYGQGKVSAGKTWYKAKITHFGGDHFAIEYKNGQAEVLHNHDPHGLLAFIERHGQKGAKYEPRTRLLSLGAQEGEVHLFSLSPTELVPCFDLEDLYW